MSFSPLRKSVCLLFLNNFKRVMTKIDQYSIDYSKWLKPTFISSALLCSPKVVKFQQMFDSAALEIKLCEKWENRCCVQLRHGPTRKPRKRFFFPLRLYLFFKHFSELLQTRSLSIAAEEEVRRRVFPCFFFSWMSGFTYFTLKRREAACLCWSLFGWAACAWECC